MKLRLGRFWRSLATEPVSTKGITMTQPDLDDLRAYLGDQSPDGEAPWADWEIEQALAAEAAAQRSVCKVPAADAEWPADLAEALRRRVHHNLELRALPLGVQGSVTEGAFPLRVGGTDAEVRRLEAPHRKRIVG